jgi:hypothetical protein
MLMPMPVVLLPKVCDKATKKEQKEPPLRGLSHGGSFPRSWLHWGTVAAWRFARGYAFTAGFAGRLGFGVFRLPYLPLWASSRSQGVALAESLICGSGDLIRRRPLY